MRAFIGKVVSDKMTKSCVVAVARLVKHPLYNKYVKKTKKFMVREKRMEKTRFAEYDSSCLCTAIMW